MADMVLEHNPLIPTNATPVPSPHDWLTYNSRQQRIETLTRNAMRRGLKMIRAHADHRDIVKMLAGYATTIDELRAMVRPGSPEWLDQRSPKAPEPPPTQADLHPHWVGIIGWEL